MNKNALVDKALEEGKGILRLMPNWVPRTFARPGKRLRLHPDDYYILGKERGPICERWLSSTTHAENGKLTPEDEGLSYVALDKQGREKITMRDMVEFKKDQIIGKDLWDKYKRWPIYSKFFDNMGPLPHHIHHREEHAKRVGMAGKPEMYFFPTQMNNHGGEFPFTFFGFNPDTTKEQVLNSLKNYAKRDNNILGLSKAYKLELDTGWDVPPGIMHAPGSLCTYEPQFASDISAMYQSVMYNGELFGEDMLWMNCPKEELGNYEYLMDLIDWDLNTDPDFHKNRYMIPHPVKSIDEMKEDGYQEEWICYKSDKICAKRLTIFPRRTVTIKDLAAYGIICIQGHGKFGVWELGAAVLIHYGSLSDDEFFVTEKAAKEGVKITNPSDCDNIVILKHFSENSARPVGL